MSLEGTAKLRIHGSERDVRFDAAVFCRRPAGVRLEATDFLDHLVFLAIVRNDQLATYSVPDNLFSEGRAVPEHVQAFLGVPLDVEELVSLVLGSPFFVALRSPKLDVSLDEGTVLLKACETDGDLCYQVRVDGQCRPVESLLTKGLHGEGVPVRIRAEFGKYRPVGSVDFPFRICITDEKSGWYSAIQYRSISLNQDLPEDLFEFVPPEDAQRASF